MCDIWLEVISNDVSSELKITLDKDLSEIPPVWQVSADLKYIIYAVQKEFLLDTNYPKEHGKICCTRALYHMIRTYITIPKYGLYVSCMVCKYHVHLVHKLKLSL